MKNILAPALIGLVALGLGHRFLTLPVGTDIGLILWFIAGLFFGLTVAAIAEHAEARSRTTTAIQGRLAEIARRQR